MQANIDEVYGCLRRSKLSFGPHKGELKSLEHYAFRDDPKEAKVFWDVRKGLIPIVGGARESGALFESLHATSTSQPPHVFVSRNKESPGLINERKRACWLVIAD